MNLNSRLSLSVAFCIVFLSFGEIAKAQECVMTLKGHQLGISSLAISSDAKMIASGDSYVDKPGTVKLWDLSTGRELLSFRQHTQGISGLAFSPDGRIVASAGHDNKVRLWRSTTGKEVAVIEAESAPWDPWFWPDGKTLVIATLAKSFQLWDISETAKPRLRKSPLTDLPTSGPAEFSADRKTVAVGFNFVSKKSPIGRGGVIVYDTKTLKELQRFQGQNESLVESLAFSPNSKKLAVGGDDNVARLWDIKKGGAPLVLRGHNEHVMVVSFSPDGKLLATADYNGVIKLWDVRSGNEVATLSGHEDGVTGLVFTSNGKLMLSSSLDRTLKIWKVPASTKE